ncbi:MAG: hypothetical protein LBI28_00990 [Treponema sp.]|nr:hypothetical protein [Treponema sp.]
MPCIALIAFIAVMGFSMVSCESDDHDPDADPAKFYGSWKRSAVLEDNITVLTITFDESGSFSINPGTQYQDQYYVTTGLNQIRFRIAGTTYTYKYKLNDNTVKLTGSGNHITFNGTYIKE